MRPAFFGVVQIQKVPTSSEFCHHCIPLRPGIFIGTQPDKGIFDKIRFDMQIDQFLEEDNDKTIKLSDLFDVWEREITELNERALQKIGVDVMTLGSKKTVKEHKCKFCDKIFTKAQALGGHISKMHSEGGRRLSKEEQATKESKKKRIKKLQSKKVVTELN